MPGNHDSDATGGASPRFDNVTVLDPGGVTIGDVRIAGIGHPSFTATNELDDDEVAADLEAQQAEVEALVAAEQPDVLAVHDPRQADTVLGDVPLVVAGHVHEHRVEEDGRHGRDHLRARPGPPGWARSPSTPTCPTRPSCSAWSTVGSAAIDAVSLRGTGGEFRLERQVFEVSSTPDVDIEL